MRLGSPLNTPIFTRGEIKGIELPKSTQSAETETESETSDEDSEKKDDENKETKKDK